MLMARYLRRCQTVVVQNLEQARNLAQELLPQVVIIDLAAEHLDPEELERLSREWAMPRVSFLACPLPGEEPLRQRLVVDGYLVKPVTRQSLLNILRQFGENVDNVLVISNDREFARLSSCLLTSPIRGYQVVIANNAQEGLALMQDRPPEVILIDLALEDVHGFELIERIRSRPKWKKIPVVVVSAQDEIDSLKNSTGTMLITIVDGFMPVEVVQWAQKALDLNAHPWLSGEEGRIDYSMQ